MARVNWHVGALLVAGGDVVGARRSRSTCSSACLGADVAGRRADDHGELTLEVHLGEDGGSRIVSPSPITEVDGLRKISGVVGASPPISFAWSA